MAVVVPWAASNPGYHALGSILTKLSTIVSLQHHFKDNINSLQNKFHNTLVSLQDYNIISIVERPPSTGYHSQYSSQTASRFYKLSTIIPDLYNIISIVEKKHHKLSPTILLSKSLSSLTKLSTIFLSL